MTLAKDLESVVGLLGMRRTRSPLEAPVELSNAYASAILACAFARLGDQTRAAELTVAASLAIRERATDDPTHEFLLGVFDDRLRRSLDHEPLGSELSRDLDAIYMRLDRVVRFKVDRALELLRTVGVSGLDSIGTWIRDAAPTSHAGDSPLIAIRRIQPIAARVTHVATMMESTTDDAVRHACLDALAELPAEDAFPALAPIVAQLAGTHPGLHAKACYVAARHGFGELLPALVETIVTALEPTRDESDLRAILLPTLRALHWHGMSDQLQRIADRVQRDGLPTAIVLVLAGIRASLDDPRGSAELERHVLTLPRRRMLGYSLLDPARDIAVAATFAGLTGRTWLERLYPLFGSVSDSAGTNSHFCLSVLYYIDTLALAHVDLALANVNVLDPAVQPLLAAGFIW